MNTYRLLIAVLALVTTTLFAQASPADWAAEGWTTDFSRSSVVLDDIKSGGPGRDGIPPIDAPQFRAVADITDLTPQDPVMGLEINGDARAYPLRVLMWHEVANDVVGGQPVAVTYCPLCNATLVFERTVDGKLLDFGTTGKLRNSDLIMYDRQTQSWWQQFTGEGIVGTFNGKALKAVPARLESFADFKARFPNGKVLVPNDASLRDYGRNPYAGYDSLPRPFLYDGTMPEGIEPLARVVMIRGDGKVPVIVTLERLRKEGKMSIGEYDLKWQAGQASALDDDSISKGRDVGSVVVQSSGVDVTHEVTFAFVAHAFYPDVVIGQ